MPEHETGPDRSPDETATPVRLAPRADGSAVPVRFETSSLRRGAIVVLAVFAAFQLILWSFSVLGSFLFLLLLAWLLSIAMEPAVAWLANRGMRRGLATGVVALGLTVVAVAFLAIFGSLFFTQLAALVTGLPDYIAQTVTWLNSTFELDLDTNKILDQLQISPSTIATIGSDLAGGIFGILGALFSVVFDALTVLVFAYYFSADGPRLRRAIGSWLPVRYQKVFVQVWDIAVIKTGGFVVSKVLLATMSAFFHCGFFYLINIPYWLPMGIFAGVVSQFIPTIGTYIGVAVPAIFAALDDPIDVIWIILFATVYQQIENYVFTPRVSRVTMDIHPAVALGSVFVGFAFFGPIGAIIGIPLAAAIIAVIETYGDRYELVPELAVRTRGEKPARPGDSLGGDPAAVVAAGVPLRDAAAEAEADGAIEVDAEASVGRDDSGAESHGPGASDGP
jgi:predicted PurR-regulated permease PerM